MATGAIDLGRFNVGSVDRIELTFTKDGVAWTGIDSVELTFRKPNDGPTFVRDMTLDSGAVWYYTTDTGDIDEVGTWNLAATVVDGAITKTYPYPITLDAYDQPNE